MTDGPDLKDPMFSSRECRSCQAWLPCCVIDSVKERAQRDGVSSSDVILSALREYLGEDFAEPARDGGLSG